MLLPAWEDAISSQQSQSPATQRFQKELLAAQAEWVYGNLKTVALTPLLAASLLVVVTWHATDQRLATAWLTILVLIALGRLVLGSCYFRSRASADELPVWLSRYTLGSFLSGLAWGSASIAVYVSEQLAYQTLLAFMVGGLGAGAAATQHYYPRAFRAWLYPATLPLAAKVFTEADAIHLAMGCMGLAYVLAMDWVARRAYKSLVAGFQLRFENRDLVEQLTSAQTALKRSNLELEQRVNERTAALIATQTEKAHVEDELRHAQKLEALGQLTGGVAHDFNNLLTVIVSVLGLVERRVSHMPEIANLVETANSAADRGSRLTQSLLAFSRKQMLSPTAIELSRELDTGGLSLIRSAVGARVQVNLHLPESLWSVHADVDQLQAALLNMCVNARDAMPDGGELRIEAQNVFLEAERAALPPGEYVRIAVTDTGVGMSASVRERVFEPFFTTKGVGQGSGLGLSMVYGFARQSKGDVEINSEPGQGTTVAFWLPRYSKPSITGTAVGRKQALGRGAGQRILFVEDELTLRKIVERLLIGLGYEVVVAPNADTALSILEREEPFDVLFSDVIMPGKLTGLELARRAQEQQPALRVLLSSGYTAFPEAGSDPEPANYPMLVKPYRPAELAEALQELLNDEQRGVGWVS